MAIDIGIDLGTANVLIHLKGRGIVLNEPSVVAIDTNSSEIIAYGRPAYDMLGRTPEGIEVIYPLKGGVIADFDMTEKLLQHMIERVYRPKWFVRANILIGAPSNVSEVEREALIEAVERVTRGRIYIEEEAKVSGVGSGIDLDDPAASMVIDIGGGTSDIAIISQGEVIHSSSLKLAGDDFDQLIIQYLQDEHLLLVGQRSAENLKKAVATALPLPKESLTFAEVSGRNLQDGLPKALNIHSNQIFAALRQAFIEIAREAQKVLEEAEPEMIADIIEKGITLTGGGAMIPNFDRFLSNYLKVSVILAEQPMNTVVLGTGLMMDWIQTGRLAGAQLTFGQRVKKRLLKWRRRVIGY